MLICTDDPCGRIRFVPVVPAVRKALDRQREIDMSMEQLHCFIDEAFGLADKQRALFGEMQTVLGRATK